MARVNVIYHHFPHYRRPVLQELAASAEHDYSFWGSHQAVSGIEPFTGDDTLAIRPLHFATRGRRWILSGYWPAIFDRSVDAVIILANPNMLATWKMALVARLSGKKVLFWAHGWLRREPLPKRLLRHAYYRLAHTVMVYGTRARALGEANGFPARRIAVVYNSLDFERSRAAFDRLRQRQERGKSGSALAGLFDRAMQEGASRPVLICTARLIAACRFDLLFHAARRLQDAGRPVDILLVGDGPERLALERLAAELGLSVNFYGACYDESVLAELIYGADLTVSPGKIGLTVIHSLSYGTPAITHDNLDEQMPEVEAIIPGVTGALFKQNDAGALAACIADWLDSGRDRALVRLACRKVVEDVWNPATQRRLIDGAVSALVEAKKPSERPKP
ncbi:MAG: glycosyltransferase family 4 protein [Neorhizobium sp.]|nr:glycosyltransferase family 4 protein [Neorhizobium sp.]